MLKNQGLISVVIPVYNGERYLAEAINSVLSQDYRPLEIIVVDDGSTDGSAKVAQAFGSVVRYHYQAHAGVSSARNLGVECAQGEFLAFLDADDLWVQDKLTQQVATLTADVDLDIVFGHVSQFHSPDLDDETKRRIKCPDTLLRGFHPGCMLLRLATFLRVGMFRADIAGGYFIEWYARAVEKELKLQTMPDILMLRRLHNTNIGLTEPHRRLDYARVLGEVIRRRHQKPV
ncbi:MAG: glycosyltransferase family A protein [Chloroflexi bacterium]|nr:glycosyltransferase family A protein [Chloroflexota bacterium]